MAESNTQDTSCQEGILSRPSGQISGQSLTVKNNYCQLLEILRHLQQTMEENFLQLTRHRQQDLVLEEQRLDLEQQCVQAIQEQKVLVDNLMGQLADILQSGSWSDLGLQLAPPSVDSSSNDDGGQGDQSPRQPNQLLPLSSESQTTFSIHDLSNRGKDMSDLYHFSFKHYNAYQADKYHKTLNTLGFINLCTSENKLCTDLMMARLSKSDMNYIEEALLQYPDWRGQPFLREEVARFLTYYCKTPAPLDPENVVVLNGCGSIFSALAMVLCDVGEVFLIPTPFYGGLIFSSHIYAKVELFFIYLDSEITEENTQPFQLTVDKLEQGLHEARLKGKKVRGLVLINPQNPLGDIYSRDSLKEYLEFAKRHKLHVIIDELYMLSVFGYNVTFHSVLSLESLPDPNRTHVIWGTSKDFGISGFRFGTLYTHSKEVAAAMSAFGYFHSLSGITQYKLSRLLQDRGWIDNVYLFAYHSRLQEAHKYVTDKLTSLEIPFLNRNSGLYIWMNLKKYLHSCTFEEEQALHRRFVDNKVLVSCGKSYMCKEPGWFRLVFADKPYRLKQGMHRFCETLQEQKEDLVLDLLDDVLKE
ncbi:PREDICTED: probable inactive 1-aminocyclopropane-1-carboxylate synthase-like protein 2 [Chrysochloris asiatica]|uniref:Probable inactive 1-aminocyclopropane-1-carboxylate synthase-like protein 2 n=1 Tax=Chrysochloris asiatica TaxID=185453 RepID=A0A9B0WSC6_CHRAS|nr:PREDICTED: probable inactive 1-aminocyclopropane-1-carboxylate synthase-like protein 2 [Chrysochloris asiatica]